MWLEKCPDLVTVLTGVRECWSQLDHLSQAACCLLPGSPRLQLHLAWNIFPTEMLPDTSHKFSGNWSLECDDSNVSILSPTVDSILFLNMGIWIFVYNVN